MQDKIKELFAMLSRADQLELLRELTSSTEIENPVIRINEINQMQYGQNISFKVENIGDDKQPLIRVELTSAWGIFEGTGANQKIAKAIAAQIALQALYNQE